MTETIDGHNCQSVGCPPSRIRTKPDLSLSKYTVDEMVLLLLCYCLRPLANFGTYVREEATLIVKLPIGWAHLLLLCFFLFGCGHGINSSSTRQASAPSVIPAATPAAKQTPTQTKQDYDNNLTFACGSKGMSADFVTGNCISRSGNQVNPLNLHPPFQAPVPRPPNNELILRCQGRGVDLVTGRCM